MPGQRSGRQAVLAAAVPRLCDAGTRQPFKPWFPLYAASSPRDELAAGDSKRSFNEGLVEPGCHERCPAAIVDPCANCEPTEPLTSSQRSKPNQVRLEQNIREGADNTGDCHRTAGCGHHPLALDDSKVGGRLARGLLFQAGPFIDCRSALCTVRPQELGALLAAGVGAA